MPPQPASGFRPTVPPPHRACAAPSASHDPSRGHLSSWPPMLADIPPHGIYFGEVNNNGGVISGFYLNGTVTDGFIDNNGSITTLTGPSGATATQAFGLNNEGEVVGDYT